MKLRKMEVSDFAAEAKPSAPSYRSSSLTGGRGGLSRSAAVPHSIPAPGGAPPPSAPFSFSDGSRDRSAAPARGGSMPTSSL